MAIWRDGKLTLSRGFGRADTATIFEAASLTKPLVAAIVLELAKRGAIDLDKPLVDYLAAPYVHRQMPWRDDGPTDEVTDERIKRITARLVLSHRTGFPNWAFGKKLDFIREPGEWGYSGEGYTLLQQAIEKLTGRDLQSLAAEIVLRPLGMNRTGMAGRFAPMDNRATGVDEAGRDRPINTGLPGAAGTMATTLDDYVRFVAWAMDQRSMQQPEGEADRGAGLQWSLGWGLAEEDGQPHLFHWGSNEGFKSFVLLDPKRRTGFLFFSNSDQGLALVRPLIDSVFGHSRFGRLLTFRMLQIPPAPQPVDVFASQTTQARAGQVSLAWVDFIRGLPPESAGKQMYVNFLKDRYGYVIGSLNQAYGIDAQSFTEMETFPWTTLDLARPKVREDDEAFRLLIAEKLAANEKR